MITELFQYEQKQFGCSISFYLVIFGRYIDSETALSTKWCQAGKNLALQRSVLQNITILGKTDGGIILHNSHFKRHTNSNVIWIHFGLASHKRDIGK